MAGYCFIIQAGPGVRAYKATATPAKSGAAVLNTYMFHYCNAGPYLNWTAAFYFKYCMQVLFGLARSPN